MSIPIGEFCFCLFWLIYSWEKYSAPHAFRDDLQKIPPKKHNVEIKQLESAASYALHATNSFLFSIYEHLFEYIGTQFPPPSSLLYGKMGSITLFFQMGILNMRQHFMHWILVGSSHYFTSYCNESGHICETLKGEDLFGQ